MAEVLSSFFLLLGAFFMLVAAIGVLRMPDLFMRLHSSTKSATFGVGFIMLAALIFFNDFAISVRLVAIVVFMYATAPVAAHMIGRAGYLGGVPLWEHTLSDEMKGCYDPETHVLTSQSPFLESVGADTLSKTAQE